MRKSDLSRCAEPMSDTAVEVGLHRSEGILSVPEASAGLVIFAHGSGSSHLSVRNRAVATSLNERGLATLLFDLLKPGESDDRRLVFDIRLLADRLLAATAWAREHGSVGGLPFGYFGASTGAAAALTAAAEEPAAIGAVVSRGGRPDLVPVGDLLRVLAPTLLIVGGHDQVVLELNHEAESQMRCDRRLEVVPGATHLFEEPGALERVMHLANAWFLRYLVGEPADRGRGSSA
jgi:putative phosphoribosyl transferase